MSLFIEKVPHFYNVIPLDFQETQRLMQEPVPGISAVPDEQNARYFHVVVAGKLEIHDKKVKYV